MLFFVGQDQRQVVGDARKPKPKQKTTCTFQADTKLKVCLNFKIKTTKDLKYCKYARDLANNILC